MFANNLNEPQGVAFTVSGLSTKLLGCPAVLIATDVSHQFFKK